MDSGDVSAAQAILTLIVEEERRTEEIRRRTSPVLGIGMDLGTESETVDVTAISLEQNLNREQVQEQEQEQEQEEEQEKEKEKEEENVEELEEEEYLRLRYSRDDEEPVPWSIADLNFGPAALGSKLGFYPLSQYCIHKNLGKSNLTMKFPEFLYVSRNHFHPHWAQKKLLKRLKNVIVVLEWESGSQSHTLMGMGAKALTHAVGSVMGRPSVVLTSAQEEQLAKCYELLDGDGDGYLTKDDLTIVSKIA